MTLSETFSANLRSIRTSRRITQTDLAERARISVSYVSMLERCQRTPPLDTLETLGNALQISPLRLLEPTSERRRPVDLRRRRR